jgi:hypothetical protein
MSTIRERDAVDLTPDGKQRVWRHDIDKQWSDGEMIEIDPVEVYADRRALLAALDALVKAAEADVSCQAVEFEPDRCPHVIHLRLVLAAARETAG